MVVIDMLFHVESEDMNGVTFFSSFLFVSSTNSTTLAGLFEFIYRGLLGRSLSMKSNQIEFNS